MTTNEAQYSDIHARNESEIPMPAVLQAGRTPIRLVDLGQLRDIPKGCRTDEIRQ